MTRKELIDLLKFAGTAAGLSLCASIFVWFIVFLLFCVFGQAGIWIGGVVTISTSMSAVYWFVETYDK